MRQHGNDIFMGSRKSRAGSALAAQEAARAGRFRSPRTGSTWLDVGTTATRRGEAQPTGTQGGSGGAQGGHAQ
ncbi:MAG: hypothetical protein J2P17_18905, partial [Mycobacterium sp.]|nr:hypothetical protein [Mycobacterium sp.]